MSRVPAEFQGKARVFRDRIVAADTVVVDVSKRIEKMVNDRYRRSRSLKLRPEMLIDIARDWKTRIPAFGRINLKTTPGKASLRIDETRVMQSVGGYESWNGETELGVVVERISLNIEGESTQLTRTPLAIVTSIRSRDGSCVRLRSRMRTCSKTSDIWPRKPRLRVSVFGSAL